MLTYYASVTKLEVDSAAVDIGPKVLGMMAVTKCPYRFPTEAEPLLHHGNFFGVREGQVTKGVVFSSKRSRIKIGPWHTLQRSF